MKQVGQRAPGLSHAAAANISKSLKIFPEGGVELVALENICIMIMT